MAYIVFGQARNYFPQMTSAGLWISISQVGNSRFACAARPDLVLYSDMNHELKTTLIEEYSCEKEPDDGTIYRKIRQHQESGNAYFEQRWWARLAAISDRKKKNLKRILDHPEYRSAFDCQLDIPGLGGGMRLGTAHTMFAMRCDEVRISK
jgi:hypothetical protein